MRFFNLYHLFTRFLFPTCRVDGFQSAALFAGHLGVFVMTSSQNILAFLAKFKPTQTRPLFALNFDRRLKPKNADLHFCSVQVKKTGKKRPWG